MQFQYYWDHGIWPNETGEDEMVRTPADMQKLVQRVQRGGALLDQAATHGDGADTIMDNFEQTLSRFKAHFGSIADQDKQLAAILTAMGGNGGPSLDDTFHPATPPPLPATAGSSVVMVRVVDHTTGDPVK